MERIIVNYFKTKFFVLSDFDKSIAIIKVEKGNQDITDKVILALKEDIAEGDINLKIIDVIISDNVINGIASWEEGEFEFEMVVCEVY